MDPTLLFVTIKPLFQVPLLLEFIGSGAKEDLTIVNSGHIANIMKYKKYIKPLTSYQKLPKRISSPININTGGVPKSSKVKLHTKI